MRHPTPAARGQVWDCVPGSGLRSAPRGDSDLTPGAPGGGLACILHGRGRMSLKGLVDPAQQEVVREERRILNDLRTSLVRFGASDENMAPLERSIEQLDELFLLVVVGEFNAGKSAFINALAGQRVMEEGVTPTTAHVTPVRIDDINIVDTPGTNAIIREHEQITSEYVPRADLVLFVTSADRPFTETERLFLERIRDWGKKIVVVINKVDILARREGTGRGPRLRGRQRAPAARRLARDLSRQRQGGAPREDRGAAALDVERVRAARALHQVHARSGGADAAEADESPGRRRRADRSLHGLDARARGARCRRTSRCWTTSRGSSGCSRRTWRASSKGAWRRSTTCCSRWSAAATISSTTRCGSAA